MPLDDPTTPEPSKPDKKPAIRFHAHSDQNAREWEHVAKHRRVSVPSTDTGTYDFQTPGPRPNTAEETVAISDLAYVYTTNAVVFKAINLRANRVVGDGFELLPSDQEGADHKTAEQARKDCIRFLNKIGYKKFFKQACVNAYVAGNEWTELIYNKFGHLVHAVHGDFTTIDYRRNFINNKIILDSNGEPAGYWQYIKDLSQLYYALTTYYGEVPAYENLRAAKERLEASRNLMISATDPVTGKPTDVAVMFSTTKPNYMFLKKNEIAHLSFNNLNDNYFGISLILPAYNALNHLEQVMYATAEAINDMGYPKPVVEVGDEKHPPTDALNDLAEEMVTNPIRKESFTMPYYVKLRYLEPGTTGQSNIANYPEWFINEVAVGLRVPKELLIGGGDSNRATAESNSSDFDRDIEADRAPLEAYVNKILNIYLDSRGYKESAGGDNLYLPKIKWPALITADEALREKMALERWNADAITFNELRRALKMDEVEDRGNLYHSELAGTGQPSSASGPEYGGLLTSQEGQPAIANPEEQGPTITGKHALDITDKQNEWLNKNLMTQGVDYEDVARDNVGTKIKTVSKRKAKLVRDAIVNGEAQKKTVEQILKAIMRIGGYSEPQARVIFWTEHKSFAEHGSLEDAKNKGFKFKQWVATIDKDTSPVCRALHGKTVPIDGEFNVTYTQAGKTKSWRGKAPAAHPNCRSYLAFGKTARFQANLTGAYRLAFEGLQTAISFDQQGVARVEFPEGLPPGLDKTVFKNAVMHLTEILKRERAAQAFHVIPPAPGNWFAFQYFQEALDGLPDVSVQAVHADTPPRQVTPSLKARLANAWKARKKNEFDKERKEHPSFTDEQIQQIVEDHRARAKSVADVQELGRLEALYRGLAKRAVAEQDEKKNKNSCSMNSMAWRNK